MSEKQDRTVPRTATDLERKYNFGKTFAEFIGLINESRDKVDAVESKLTNEITTQSTLLKRDTEQIVMQATQTVKTELGDSINEVKKQVEAKLDAEAVTLAVRSEVSSGIELETGYRFDTNGLQISKSGEEISNLLDHTGMYVKRGDDDILTANSKGVDALKLQSAYLTIGKGDGRSRFEDYGTNRTGCFWLG